MASLREPLFYSYEFVVCNLKAHIQQAPDFVQHERVYHPLCTFGPPTTKDIEASLNDEGRFGGCLLFQDQAAAEALRASHLNVRQIVLIACPLPALPNKTEDLHAQAFQPAPAPGLLCSLVRLVFRDCDQLKVLPDVLRKCEALRGTLVVHRCSNLRDFGPLHDIPNVGVDLKPPLRHLFLLACPALRGELELEKLQELRLCIVRDCSSLTVVVNEVHENLMQLVVSQTDLSMMPICTTITLLTLRHAQYNTVCLKYLPDVVFQKLPNLRHLDISDCAELKDLPRGVSQLGDLRMLALRRCRAFVSIPETVSMLKELTSLDLGACSSLRTLPSTVGNLSQLRRLCLSGCGSLKFLPQSTHRLTALTHLVLSDCTSLDSLPHRICSWHPPEVRQPLKGFEKRDGVGDVARREVCAEWPLGDVMRALAVRRQLVVLERLLRDRASRRAALEKLSIVAAILAAAARVSFDLSPSTREEFEDFQADAEAPQADEELARAFFGLQVFHIAQQLSFTVSMTLIMYVLVSGIPANENVDDLVTAADIWIKLTVGCVLLAVALLSSILAFFAGGLAVYPERLLRADIQPVFKLTCWLVVWVLYAWASALSRIFPGWPALHAYAVYQWDLACGKPQTQRGPPPGVDDVAEGVDDVLRAACCASSNEGADAPAGAAGAGSGCGRVNAGRSAQHAGQQRICRPALRQWERAGAGQREQYTS
eukprot:jgi/Ulvmu1/7088/UM033_0149.1